MNIEIKFRAFHKPSEEMYWFDIMDGTKSNTGGGYIAMAPFGEDITKTIYKDNMRPIDPQDCELMQFTGLIDKNGKEIYEGDIYHMGDNTITYTVVWNDSGFIGKQNGSSSYAGLEYWMDRIEIIGNVYENQNLIN